MAKRQTNLLSFLTPVRKKKESVETIQHNDEDSDDEVIKPKSVCRKRNPANTMLDSDNEDNDVKNLTSEYSSPKSKKMKLSSGNHCSITLFSPASPKSSTSSKSTNSKLMPKNDDTSLSQSDESKYWTHETLEFLHLRNVRDKQNRRPDHPDYDGKTLKVPTAFKESLTPAMRQWWEIKSDHFDCILFFKVGKFYELYHMDAVTGVKELGLTFMKGAFAHSGFPESAYGKMSSMMVNKGYKVARVEQTETPEMLAERCKTSSAKKYDKVVKREVCQITTQGTIVNNVQDADTLKSRATYMISLIEKSQFVESTEKSTVCVYGVCFIETSLGEFHFGQFEDDILRSKLLSLITQYPPALVIYPRNLISEETKNIINTNLSTALKESLIPEKQFLSSEKAIKMMIENKYFRNKDNEIKWPNGLCKMLSGEGITVMPLPEYEMAINAFGGALWYLADSYLDVQLLEMRNFKIYEPQNEKKSLSGTHMIIDAITLHNLYVIDEHSYSLFKKLDYCSTAFGKRLLRQWMAAPLCRSDLIKERQESVKTLVENEELLREVKQELSKLPDLERLLAKIHALGNKHKSESHPDSRAILYEEKIYSKKKISNFLSILSGFERATEIVKKFEEIENAGLLTDCMKLVKDGGTFPDLSHKLNYFQSAFNRQQAEEDGILLPKHQGIDHEYDTAIADIDAINEELKNYLVSQEKFFGCKITYFGNDKKRFQLEVPGDYANKATREYHLEGTKKSGKMMKRFSTSKTKELLSKMIAAEEKKRIALKDLSRRIYEKFSEDFFKWNQAVKCLAILDALLSLAEYCLDQSTVKMCLPKICATNKPFIKLKQCYHPILNSDDFIPNNIEMGTENWAPLMILTGPNMGGKSTLMRQSAMLTIMAQIGSYVPAESFELTLVDRLFTRLGASDDIMNAKSTFDVELSETKVILDHSTEHSLVLIDELGRGTSTHDGVALAGAVLDWLSARNMRTIFCTHFSELVLEFQKNLNCTLAHMGCKIDENLIENDSSPRESIIFMYTLLKGVANRSYAFNAAYLAGVPKKVVDRGFKAYEELYKRDMGIMWINELMDIDSINTAFAFVHKWKEIDMKDPFTGKSKTL